MALCCLQINWLIGKHIVSVAVGRQHGLAVSTEGYVYSWGGTNLVSGRDGNVEIPALVEGDLKGRRMMLVAAGEVRPSDWCCECWFWCWFWCCLW